MSLSEIWQKIRTAIGGAQAIPEPDVQEIGSDYVELDSTSVPEDPPTGAGGTPLPDPAELCRRFGHIPTPPETIGEKKCLRCGVTL